MTGIQFKESMLGQWPCYNILQHLLVRVMQKKKGNIKYQELLLLYIIAGFRPFSGHDHTILMMLLCYTPRLYNIPRKSGGKRLIATEDCIELAARGLELYVYGSEERLIQAARGDKLDGLEAASVLKKAKKQKRLQDQKEKALHGHYFRQTKEGVSNIRFGFRMEI